MPKLLNLAAIADLTNTNRAVLGEWSHLPDFPEVRARSSNAKGRLTRQYDPAEVTSWIEHRRATQKHGRKVGS